MNDQLIQNVRSNALTYGTTPNAPATIYPEDIDEWKANVSPTFKHYFKERYDEIVKLYETLAEEYAINKMLYECEMSFQPKIGEIYYLYNTSRKGTFISLVSPESAFWGGFVGSFKLNSQYAWEKVTSL